MIGMLIVLLILAEKIVNGFFAAIPRRKPNANHANQVQLIAHRGAHNNNQGIFENTHDAFRLAKKSGCWGIELDVHATADNILVVNHDPTLKRLWGKDVAISDITFSALRALAPGVPSLEEVVADYASQLHLFIELKSPFHAEEALVKVLQHISPCKDYHLLSLDPHIFNALSQFPKNSMLLVAAHNNVKEFCELSIKENYGGVLANYLLLGSKRIKQLKEANQLSGVGFVNSKNCLYRELNRGIKWIFTNQAVALNPYLKNLGNLPSRSKPNKESL
jgi:glycerophosphoryl diester phosphodiesterase